LGFSFKSITKAVESGVKSVAGGKNSFINQVGRGASDVYQGMFGGLLGGGYLGRATGLSNSKDGIAGLLQGGTSGLSNFLGLGGAKPIVDPNLPGGFPDPNATTEDMIKGQIGQLGKMGRARTLLFGGGGAGGSPAISRANVGGMSGMMGR